MEWPDVDSMTESQVRAELVEQRKRYDIVEKDLYKQMAESRKYQAQITALQQLTAAQGITMNNTSSTFTLPSEFKKLWDELITEHLLDAFPDLIDDYKKMTVLTQ